MDTTTFYWDSLGILFWDLLDLYLAFFFIAWYWSAQGFVLILEDHVTYRGKLINWIVACFFVF